MIGNAADAAIAAGITVQYDNDWNAIVDAPKGWRMLGEGCYRRAFQSPEGVVYKVEYDNYAKGSNHNEAKVFAAYGDSVQGFRLAPCTLWGDVLAMDFYEHDWNADYSRSVHEAAVWLKSTFNYVDVINKDGENYFADASGLVTVTDYAYDVDLMI